MINRVDSTFVESFSWRGLVYMVDFILPTQVSATAVDLTKKLRHPRDTCTTKVRSTHHVKYSTFAEAVAQGAWTTVRASELS